jgi:hypothetical protein
VFIFVKTVRKNEGFVMTFWDLCAPFYDKAEQANTAYNGMLRMVRDLTPKGAKVLHLIDEPQKAAEELKRISSGTVITTVALLKGLRGFFARSAVVWRKL